MTTIEEATPAETGAGSATAAPTAGRGRDKKGSLHPVLAVIPDSCYERPTWKGIAYFARDMAVYALGIGLLIAFPNPLVVVPVWLVTSLAISGLFVVGHDAAHSALFSSRRLNGIIGRIAMLPSLHVFEGWVLGHNRVHHHFTACQGYDFVWHPTTPEEWDSLPRWKRLRHRLEWSWIGPGAYYVREIWWNKMMVGKVPKRFAKAVHRDRVLVTAFAVAAVAALAWAGLAQSGTVAGALWMVTRVLVVPFLGFAFIIGSVVHVHHIAPDIRWWPRKEWTKFAGQVEATTILETPRWLDFFFHSIMVHIPHHVDQRIPMYHLAEAAEAISEHFPEARVDKLAFRGFVANTRVCKLYDFETGTWHRYPRHA